ncbi:MAG: pyridoxamine 5'-phosphate oxidase [Flavobacteriaceae bacterium]|nr:MAG: pyridoxamine 5'-phosphate oxidase [Flavobacteriaceae bacterium]
MTTTFFNEIKQELQAGVDQKKHPFGFFTLGTVGLDRLARLRMVMLRAVGDDLQLVFYSDKRAKKVTHIKENNKVSLLFYHPEKFIQLKIEGIATIHSNFEGKHTLWNILAEDAKKNYSTSLAPGSTIKAPENIKYLDDDNHFCQIKVEPFKIEYLKIQSPSHIRVRFSKNNDDWVGEYLVP